MLCIFYHNKEEFFKIMRHNLKSLKIHSNFVSKLGTASTPSTFLPADAGFAKTPARHRLLPLAGLQSIFKSPQNDVHFFPFPTGMTSGKKLRHIDFGWRPQTLHTVAAGPGQRAGWLPQPPLPRCTLVLGPCQPHPLYQGQQALGEGPPRKHSQLCKPCGVCHKSSLPPQRERATDNTEASGRSCAPVRTLQHAGLQAFGCARPCALGPFHATCRPSANTPRCLLFHPVVLTSGVPDAAGAGVREPYFEHHCSKLSFACLFPKPISYASPPCPALFPPDTHCPTALCLTALPVRPLG